MIEDTIRAVKEAEEKADRLVADAKNQADGIMRDAEAQSAALLDEAGAKARDTAEAIMEKVRTVGEEKLRMADLEASKEADALRKAAESKRGAAVDAVIDALLG